MELLHIRYITISYTLFTHIMYTQFYTRSAQYSITSTDGKISKIVMRSHHLLLDNHNPTVKVKHVVSSEVVLFVLIVHP